MEALTTLWQLGGWVMAAIAALSVATLAAILWKLWHLVALGAWGGQAAERALEAWRRGAAPQSRPRAGLRLRVVEAAVAAGEFGAEIQREETERVARGLLSEARRGLRFLDVVVTVAPLLGLLGTVLGMIDAFQSLQESGRGADAAVLAGGIWTALLTTAAGMGVAIPAALALAWFEAVIDRVADDMEDLATRVFLSGRTGPASRAAE